MFAVMELCIINIIRIGKHYTAGKLAQHQLKYTVKVILYRMFRLVKGTGRAELPDKCPEAFLVFSPKQSRAKSHSLIPPISSEDLVAVQ